MIELFNLLISIILHGLCFRLPDMTRTDLVVRETAPEHKLRVTLPSRANNCFVLSLVSFSPQFNSAPTISKDD